MDFAAEIIQWYHKNHRKLPWRQTRDPYKIWLSEVILQQTRVAQGTSYYHRFLEKFPTVEALAKAPESQVMKVWEGLGYYSRARNLHSTARIVAGERKGIFPNTYDELLGLKGIGDYTASAMASFCFNEAEPVVDGNVFRVLSRYFGISTPIDSSGARKEFKELARELMKGNDPATFNQAIMEFGALQCVPKSPDCSKCPLAETCFALRNKKVNELPVKEKKTAVKDRFIYYLILSDNNYTYIKKREGKDIWKGLHDFPSAEPAKAVSVSELKKSSFWKKSAGIECLPYRTSDEFIHLLSHRKLHIRLVWATLKKGNDVTKGVHIKVNRQKLKNYAMPVPLKNNLSLISDGIFAGE